MRKERRGEESKDEKGGVIGEKISKFACPASAHAYSHLRIYGRFQQEWRGRDG